jgi:uncharacterized protein YndB with AHSA1/START domain
MADAAPYDIEIGRAFDARPEDVFRAFANAARFARWYGPDGFPVDAASIQIDPRVGGRMTFTMVSDADPSMRTAFDGRFTEVVANELLACSGAWDGIPGQDVPWPSHLRVEIHSENGRTRLLVREGPHPPATMELGRQSWQMMLPKLEALLRERGNSDVRTGH